MDLPASLKLESQIENMNLMHISALGAGISFTGLGLLMRKENKRNWKAFLFGGIAMLVLVVISLVTGLSL